MYVCMYVAFYLLCAQNLNMSICLSHTQPASSQLSPGLTCPACPASLPCQKRTNLHSRKGTPTQSTMSYTISIPTTLNTLTLPPFLSHTLTGTVQAPYRLHTALIRMYQALEPLHQGGKATHYMGLLGCAIPKCSVGTASYSTQVMLTTLIYPSS